MGHKRRLAATLYRKQLPIFSVLNANVQFRHMLDAEFGDSILCNCREHMYTYLNNSVLSNASIDYFECGVAGGQSLKHWCSVNTNPQSRFFGFDTFEGLPEDWKPDKPASTFSTGGITPNIGDPRVTFVKGLFQDTLYGFLATYDPYGSLVVHIDCDLYSAALFCLAALDRFLRPGSLLVFDEFYDLPDEFAAYRDWRRAFYRDCQPLSHTASYAQVALAVKATHARPGWL
jgi:O-methyltransferase